MRILLTGTQGYIGAVMGSTLLEAGHEVVGLDTGFYREGWLFTDPSVQLEPSLIVRDVRKLTADDLRSFDAVVHLAELSNDPVSAHNPEVTYEINHRGSLRLAELAKQAGVSRFVYTSSCSVYGVADGVVTEESQTSPQTAYAKCKVLVERDVAALADESFSPVFLRNATAFGASPRMRFDIVLNNLAGLAWTKGEIALKSDGSPWRPLVHIRDICKAALCCLQAPRDAIHNEIFNVGDTNANYQIREIADVVGQTFKGCSVSFGPPDKDNRSYRVNFSKIHDQLPGFKCAWNPERGAEELRAVFSRIPLTLELFEHRAFTRLTCLAHLVESGQIDSRFFWI
jgi:nucleoside-diphosphate-sugar epimerase